MSDLVITGLVVGRPTVTVNNAGSLVSILQSIKNNADINAVVVDISALAGQTIEIAQDIDFGDIFVTFFNSEETPVIFTGSGVFTFSGMVQINGVVLPGLRLTSTGVYSDDSTATFSGRGIVRVVDEPQAINNGEMRVLTESQEWTAEGSHIGSGGSAGGVDGGGLYGLSLHKPINESSAEAPDVVLRHLAYLEIDGSQRSVSSNDASAVAQGGFAYGNVSMMNNGDVTITGNAATATAATSAVAQGGVVYGALDITSGDSDPENGDTVIIAKNVAQGITAAGGVLHAAEDKALTLTGGKIVLLAQNQALGTESAEGGVVAGGASIQASGIRHLEFNGNFAQSSGSALGGVLCGGNLGIADAAQVLFAGNAVAGTTARGSVLYNAGLSIENVGITQFRSNYEYENGTLILRSVYAQDGTAPGMTFHLQSGQTVLMYDSVYYGTTATGASSLTLDGAGVLAFSAFYVASDLAGLRNGTAASAEEITASSTSYVADTLINGGTLMVGDGAIYTGNNMTVSANGSLALYAAQSSITLSGSFVQEGSVVIDFSGMAAGEYRLLHYTSHTVGDGASIQAQNVADGLNCSITYTDTGIVATLTGEVLPHPDIRVVAASTEYTGATNSGVVAVQITLQNYGDCATSEDSTLNIYFSANGKLDGDSILASTVKLGSILASLSQNTYNLGINISSLNLPLGNYSIIVKAVDSNEQASTLQDNTATIGTLRHAPNVRVAAAETQYDELTTEGTLSVSFNLQNLGTTVTESQTTVRLYLTQNGVVDGNAISLGAVSVNTPPAGMQTQYTLNAKLSAADNLKAGAYTIVAVVSNPDEPTASTGDNASGIGTVTITAIPCDLVVQPGSSYDYRYIVNAERVLQIDGLCVENIGAGDSGTTTRYTIYLTSNGTVDENAVELATGELGSISAGTSHVTPRLNLTIPEGIMGGMYTLVARVSSDNELADTMADNTNVIGTLFGYERCDLDSAWEISTPLYLPLFTVYNFSSQETFRLRDFQGDPVMLPFYDIRDDQFIGICGELGDSSLAQVIPYSTFTPQAMPYRLVGDTNVTEGSSVSVQNTSLDLSDYTLVLNGSMSFQGGYLTASAGGSSNIQGTGSMELDGTVMNGSFMLECDVASLFNVTAGGVVFNGQSATVKNSTFADHVFFQAYRTTLVDKCNFTGNVGIAISTESLSFDHCHFANEVLLLNTSGSAQANFSHCDFSQGIDLSNLQSGEAPITLTNCYFGEGIENAVDIPGFDPLLIVVNGIRTVPLTVDSADLRVLTASAAHQHIDSNGADVVSVSIGLQNTGTIRADNATYELYLTRNGEVDESAILLQRGSVPTINVAESSPLTCEVNMAEIAAVMTGDYTLVAKVTCGSESGEYSTNNIGAIGTMNVTSASSFDLAVVAGDTVYSANKRESLELTFRIDNMGGAALAEETEYRVYLTKNGEVDDAAILVKQGVVTTPDALQAKDYTVTIDFSEIPDVAASDYQIVVTVANAEESGDNLSNNSAVVGNLELSRYTTVLVVNSLADSGEGTLRDACYYANYYGEEENVIITFAENLYGIIDLEYEIYLDREVTINNNSSGSVYLACRNWYGGVFSTSSRLTLNNMRVGGGITLRGNNATLEGTGNYLDQIRLSDFSGSIGDVLRLQTDSSLSIEIDSLSGDAVLDKLPDDGSSYRLNYCHVSSGQTLTVEEGVTVWGDVYVESGGTMRLDGARIRGSIYLYSGATLEGEGNVFTSDCPIYLKDWSGTASSALGAFNSLENSAFESANLQIGVSSLSGDAILDTLPEGFSSYYASWLYVDAGQTLTVEEGVTLKGSVHVKSGGTMRLNDTRVEASLYLYPGATLEGAGNVFASARPIYLREWNGKASDALAMLDALENTTFESENMQIGVYTISGDTVLDALPKGFSSYYASWLSVNNGQTLTVEEGVTLNGVYSVNSGGTLRLNGTRVEGFLYLSPGATLEGKGNIFTSDRQICLSNWRGNASDVLAMLDALENTTFESENLKIGVSTLSGDAVLDALPEGFSSYYASGLYVNDGDTLTVKEGVTLTGETYVESGGTLNMEGATCEGSLSIQDGANAVLNTCDLSATSLTIYAKSNTQIHNCDLSRTDLNIYSDYYMGGSSGEYTVIDLSGNWWGTTDESEIRAKIGGYYDPTYTHVIIDGWLTESPTAKFVVEDLVGSKLLSAADRSLTVCFSQAVDAASVTAETVYLEDAQGQRVPILSTTVEGKEVTLTFDTLPADGDYRLVISPGVMSTNGVTLQKQLDLIGQADYRLAFRADVTAERITSLQWEAAAQPSYLDVVLSGAIDSSTISATSGIQLLSPQGAAVSIQRVEMKGDTVIRLYVGELTEPGDYELRLPATITDSAGNALAEDSRTESVPLISSSLSIATGAAAYDAQVNSDATFPISITNSGNVAEEEVQVKVWLKDAVGNRVLLGTVTAEALAAGETRMLECSLPVAESLNLEEAGYTLVAEVSGSHELPALRANNESAIGTLNVTYPPAADLRITAMSMPETLRAGQSTDFQVTVINEGTADVQEPLKMAIYLIPAGGTLSQGVQLGTYQVTDALISIKQGATFSFTPEGVQIPADIALSGDVQVAAVVNPGGEIYEKPADRADNVYIAPEVLTLPNTLTLSVSATEVKEGDSRRVVYTITRSGSKRNALTVNLSCEQAELLGLPQTLTIAAGQSYTRYQKAIVNNSVYQGDQTVDIAVSAEGYTTSTARLTVLDDELPALTLTLPETSLAEGESMTATISLEMPARADMVVKLGSSIKGQLSMPTSVIIKAGETSANFQITAVDDTTAEIDKTLTITAKADGATTAKAELKVVDDDIPAVQLVLNRTLVSEGDGYAVITATLLRTGNMSEAVTVRLTDTNNIGLILPPSIRIGANVKAVNFNIGVVDDTIVNGERTGVITGTLILESCGCSATTSTNGGEIVSVPVTVTDNDGPTLSLKLSRTTLREGGSETAVLTVSLNYIATEDVIVTLSDASGSLEMPQVVTIAAGQSSTTADVSAKRDGVTSGNHLAVITATAAGHSSGSAYVQVTDIDLPDIVVNNVTVSGNPVAGCPLTVQVKVTNQGYAATNKPVTVKLTLSDGTVLGTVTVADNLAADATATASLEVTLPSVSGSKYITAQVDANNTIAELDALNNSKTSANFNVKAGYSITAAVDKNAVFGEDTVTISGHISTTVEGVSVANRKLYIKVRTVSNGLMANISVTTDENGNFSTTYTPTSSVVGTYSVSAEILGEQTEVLDTFEMGGVSFNFGSYTIWELNVGETRTGSFTVTNTGNVSLTNFRVNADGVPSNISLSLETYDNELEAGETMTVNYTVTGTDLTGGTSYQHITLTANSDEGYAATKDLYTYVQTVKGDLVLDVNSISERVYVKGGVRYFPFTLTNVGAGETGNIKLNINAPEWLTIYSGQEIASLASGESSTVVLAVNPPANFPTEYLNYVYSGNIKVVAENVPVKTVNYDFSFVEETTSKLTVIVSDTLSKNNGDTSIVSTARARLVNVRDSSKTYSANADASGNCIFDDVEAGTYYLYVNADGCAQSKSPVTIPAGADLREAVQLENQTVSVVWDVTRNEYVEVYTTEFTADYVTNVPHVEIGTTGTLTFKNLAWGESDTLAYTVSNYGLVAAGNFVLSLPSWNYCTFEILNNTDSIAPKDEHTFYIKLTYGDGNASHDPGTLLCASDWLRLNWTEYAGGTYQTKYDKVQTEQEICVTTGSGSGGSVPIYVPVVVPYVPIRPVPGGSTSPKAPSSPPVLVQQVASCTPCKASILNAALGYLGQDALTLGTAVTWAEELSTLGVTGDSMMQGISTNVYNTTCAVKVIEGLASCSVVTDTNLTGLMTAGVNLLKGLKSLLSGGIGSVEDLAATLSAFCQTYGLAVTDFSIASVLKAAAVKLEEYRVDVKKKFAEYQGVDVDDEIGTSSALGWLRGSSEVAWSQVSSAIAVLLCTYELSGPFDVSLLLLNDSIDNNLVFDWLRQVGEATSSGSADGHTISASEMETLCRTSALASNYGLSWYLTDLCNRWNATVQNEIGAEGSFSQAYLEALQAAFDQGSAMVKNHYTNAGAMTEAFYTGMEDFLRDTGDEVCATVTMKFSQSMLVSREEFDGTLTIKNSLAGNMTNVFFEVCVLDANGLDVTDQFEIYYYDASGLTGVNFGKTPVSGASLAENTTGSIYVRFTPGMNVAADGPENYSFSGTLSYTDGEGREVEMGLTPVTLEVNPSPNLTLHYFVQQDVYSDNPFTDAIEAPEKAQVGVLVVNNGFGAAKDFTMSNLSVEFTANQQQLPLDFSFVGVSLNGGEMQDLGMSVDFGTIEGNSSAYAVWYFETNLQGTIRLNDDLTITRTDSLGNVSVVIPGDQFSIVSAESTTHTLVRSVVMDETGKTAFLVNDDDDAAKLGDGLYFDDGQYENVNGVTYGTVAGSLGYGNYTVTVTVHLQEGYNHIRLTDPGSGNYVIRSISVAGIGDLYSGCFWQTDREIGADGSYKDNQRLHMLYNSEAEQDVTFTLAFSSVDVTAPQVLSITGVEDHTAVTTVPQIVVIFSEDVDKEYFDASQSVKLDKGGVRVDMAGVDFVWTDDRTLTFDLTGVADGDALYTLTVTNKGVADVFGNVGNGAGSDLQWTMAVQALSVKHVQLLHERQGKEKVGSVSVAFTTAVEKLTVDALQVSRIAGSVTTILEDLSGVTITPLENGSFEISGLEALQDEDGIYLIAVKTSELGAVDSSAELRWTLCRTAPALLSKSTDVAAQSCEQAKQITLQFDHEIASIDADALKLYRGGEIVTNYVLEAQVDAQDATKVVVTISEASAVAFFGAVTREAVQTIDGEWSLNVDLTGVEDIYGNVGAGNASADWVVDTTAPNVVESITLNGSSNTTVSSSTPTLGMTLPEAGLHVEIYVASITDSTLGALVWSGEVSGTEFSHEIRLPYDGRQTLSVILTDAAGNATACTYEVAMDSVALGLTIKAKEKYTQAPESIALVFSAPVNGLTTAALSLTCNGAAVDTAGLTLTQVSDTEWALGGLDSAMLENGAYTVSVDLSQLTKASSGLSGKGTVTAAFTVDSITSVEVVGSNVVSKPGSVEGLSVSFSTAINYAELSASGLLSQAVRLVNQETGEVVLLDAAGFSYADNEITWSGCVTVPAGQYAVVVDAALVTASNGAPLTLGGNAQTALSGFAASASPLGAMGASYTAPYAVDWNGDGLVDLLVGEKTGSEGKLRLYLNNGTAQVPAYSEYTYVQADGTDLSVVASGCQGIVVTLQDINGDGETDLVAGLSDGKVVCYLADGAGSFGAQQQLAALAGSRAFPTFFDRNGDGTADLVIGAGDGSVYYAAATVAGDGSLTFDTLQVIDGIKVSGRAAPVFADVNGDGMADLLVGDANGNLSLYYAVNGAYSLVKTWTLAGVDWERTRPTVADLNGDGKLDIVVGGSTGEVYALYGQENAWSSAPVTVEPLPQLSAVQLAAQGSTLTVTWNVADAPEGAIYKVQISAAGDFSDAVEFTGDASGTLSVEDVEDGTYTARIRIVMPNGVAGEWQSSVGTLVDTTAPEIPADLTAQVDGSAIAFAWGGVQDPSGVHYEIRYSRKADFSQANVREVSGNAFNISGLADGTWYWQVRAVDGKGNASDWVSGESLAVDTAVVSHWAEGVTENVGYYDVNKSGTAADNNLCWAAASSNVLAWWQQAYDTADTTHIEVTRSAQDIYATMQQNWKNVSGCEFNGFVWWLDSEACTDETYLNYAGTNLIGSDGSYYFAYFNGENLATQVVENTLKGVGKSEVAATWADLFAAGAGMTLGVYKNSTVSGTLMGGHAVSLWGFDCSHADNTLTRIYVTDSDDGVDTLVSLDVHYDTTAGLYRVDASGSKLNGYYLGNYTYLAAPAQDLFASVPAAPTGLNIMTPNKKIDFDWNAVSGAATYTLQYALDGDYANAVTLSGLTYDIYELALKVGEVAEGTYMWRVRAVGSNGELSAWAEGSSFLVDLSVEQVSGVKASVSSNALGTTVTLSWNSVTDVSGISHYNVRYSTGADFSNAKTSTAKTFFMKDGYNYYCHVNAQDGRNNIGAWSETVVIINSGTAQAGETGVLLSWLAVENASGYAVRYATDADFAEYETVMAEDASLNLVGLLSGTDYYWRVVALDGDKLMGDWSYADTFTTQVSVYNDTPAGTQSVLVLQEDDTRSVISATVNEYVGADDPEDYFRVRVDQTGTYDLSLDLNALGNPVYLSVGTLSDSDFQVISTVLVSASGGGTEALKNILLQGSTDYYVRVSTVNGTGSGYNGTYTLTMQTEKVADNRITANNTPETATRLALQSDDTAGFDGWIGVGDEVDTYRIELEEDGTLRVNLKNLDYQAKLQVYQVEHGETSGFLNRTVRTNGLDKELSVSAGTYYVQVSTIGAGSSRYNTAYSLDIETEIDGTRKQGVLAAV